jgi:hypothetical protein
MFTTLTSDSAADDLSDQPTANPWLELNYTEPGLHLTDQGLEMTSAWSFPVGSTLSVGISGPLSGEPDVDDELLVNLELLDSLEGDEESSSATASLAPVVSPSSAPRKAAVQATGIVISCIPSQREGVYQLTIYFLDHLANLILHQDHAACDFVDEPSAAGLLPPQTLKPAVGKVTHGPAAGLFGLDAENGVPNGAYGLGVMPFFLGA